MPRTKQRIEPEIHPDAAARTGFLLTLPLGFLWTVLVYGIEPLSTILVRFFSHERVPNIVGSGLAATSMVLLWPALAITARPLLRAQGYRRLYPANILVLAVIVVLILQTWGTLVSEIIRCDILHILQCD